MERFEVVDGGKAYGLRRSPVRPVEIDGRRYEARLGNLTFALEARGLAEKMRSVAEPGIGQDEVLARAEDFSNSVRAAAAAMFGDAAAEELVGGTHRLDLVRIADVIGIMADIAGSPESMAAARGALPR